MVDVGTSSERALIERWSGKASLLPDADYRNACLAFLSLCFLGAPADEIRAGAQVLWRARQRARRAGIFGLFGP
jgi:hypothetical protein